MHVQVKKTILIAKVPVFFKEQKNLDKTRFGVWLLACETNKPSLSESNPASPAIKSAKISYAT